MNVDLLFKHGCPTVFQSGTLLELMVYEKRKSSTIRVNLGS